MARLSGYSSRQNWSTSSIRPALPRSYSARMSPPAEKARSPAAIMTTRVIAGSFAHRSSSARSARTMPWVTALSAWGRLSVITPAAPRRSNRISDWTMPSLVPQHCTADDQAHDLIRTLKNLMHTYITQHAFDRVIAQVAVAAVQLQAAIDHIEPRIGCKTFCLCGEPGGGMLTRAHRNRRPMQ